MRDRQVSVCDIAVYRQNAAIEVNPHTRVVAQGLAPYGAQTSNDIRLAETSRIGMISFDVSGLSRQPGLADPCDTQKQGLSILRCRSISGHRQGITEVAVIAVAGVADKVSERQSRHSAKADPARAEGVGEVLEKQSGPADVPVTA